MPRTHNMADTNEDTPDDSKYGNDIEHPEHASDQGGSLVDSGLVTTSPNIVTSAWRTDRQDWWRQTQYPDSRSPKPRGSEDSKRPAQSARSKIFTVTPE